MATVKTTRQDKLVVHYKIWANQFYFIHNGKKTIVYRLDDARAKARSLGYAGIKVTAE